MIRSLASRVATPTFSRALNSTRFPLSSTPSSTQFRPLSTSSLLRASASPLSSHAAAVSISPSSSSTSPSSSSSSSSSPSTAVTSSPDSVRDIIAQHGGWVPLLSLGGLLAVSKEYIILNEELLLATNFVTMVTVLWLGVGDTVTASLREAQDAKKKQVDDLCDLEVDIYQASIKKLETNVDAVEVYKSLKQEYSNVVAAAIKAKDMKARAAARDAVVARLQALKTKEDSELASYLDEVYERTSNYVRQAAANLSAAEKQLLIEHAISVVGGSNQPLDPAKDPLKKLYVNYFEGRQYEKEIEQDRQNKRNRK